MTTTLITGANKGLGHMAAQRLIAHGHQVWVAARDRDRGAAAANAIGALFVQLDVTDDTSVAAAADVIANAGGLDVLINKAGISDRTPVIETAAADVCRVLDTNVLGPVRVLRAFTPLLDASSAPVVVNVSSGVGSLGYASDAAGPYAGLNLLAYPASKGWSRLLTGSTVADQVLRVAGDLPVQVVNVGQPDKPSDELNRPRDTTQHRTA